MKKSLLILSLLLLSGILSAQEKQDAVVLEDEESFRMDSPASGVYTVRRTVRIYNDSGVKAGVFQEYTDRFRSLSSFKGTITRDGGKPTKIKKDDLTMVSLASGLAEDGYLYAYSPAAAFPFTVTYEYSMSFRNGIASFPAFIPADAEKVRVEKASYTLQVPAGTEVNRISSRVEETRKEEGKFEFYRWEVTDFEGYVDEVLMPSWREIAPYAMASPAVFTYAGVPGGQRSWKEVGAWAYGLKDGTDDLPESFVDELKRMTEPAGSDLEKIRILYRFLRDHTRYVSIQLGIGGYRPFPASQVSQTGFGDCKGLSNYMQAMLAAVGIPSLYTLVNTDRSEFLPGYSGIGQMNHAMVCVPLPEKQDTLWLECTNPSVPLGYRHDRVAGHDVVLAAAEGGIPVRVPDYPDSLRLDSRELDVRLESNGAAVVSVRRTLTLDRAEGWVGIRDWKPETLRSRLTSGLAVQPQEVVLSGVSDNFQDYDGPGYCPEIQVDYRFVCRQYATVGKDRIFLPTNPFPGSLSLPRGQRQNDLVCRRGGVQRDCIRILIPEGYRIERLPDPVSLDTEWGVLMSSSRVDGKTVTVVQELKIKRFREKADRFSDFRTFFRSVNKAYGTDLVLVKE